MFWLLVTGLWAAMLLSPFILLFLFLPAGRECPRCTGETVAIRSRLMHPIRRLAAVRWCMACGWEGVARHAMMRRPLPRFEVVQEPVKEVTEVEDDAPWRATD